MIRWWWSVRNEGGQLASGPGEGEADWISKRSCWLPCTGNGQQASGIFISFTFSVLLLFACSIPHYIPEKPWLGLAVHLHPQTTPSVLVSRVPLGRQALSGLPFFCHCLEIPHTHVTVEPFMLYWALQMGSPHTPGLSVVTPGLRISLGVHSF